MTRAFDPPSMSKSQVPDDKPLIPYERIAAELTDPRGHVSLDTLAMRLEEAWLSEYSGMCDHEPNVLQFTDEGFTFLFDQASAVSQDAHDRLVAGYGLSRKQEARRDASRMQGFLGGRIEIPGKGTFDKGHVLAHAIGGGLDVNLFPQRPELNRGRSTAGKVYRRMEAYAAKHPRTFVFSRFLYADESWVPVFLEYGILVEEGRLWVERFEN